MAISSALGSSSSTLTQLNFGNLLINGAMQVSQRSAVGTAVTGITASNYYTADRWRTHISALGTWTQTTIADAPTGSGFRNSLKLDCTTADASPASTDFVLVQQKIEGQNLQAIRKGTASAQTLTLSFWVKAFQTGTFICELVAGSRAVSKSYTVAVSNTWEYKTVTFPADVSTVIANDNAEGLSVNWWLGAGTDYTSGTLQTTWGTTTTANRAVGVTNLASADTGEWFMTGAQLTVGSVSVPFEFKSFADDLRDCLRYFWRHTSRTNDGSVGSGVMYSTTAALGIILFPVPARSSAPTVTGSSNSCLEVVVAGAVLGASNVSFGDTTGYSTATGVTVSGGTAGQGAYIRFSGANDFIQMSDEL